MEWEFITETAEQTQHIAENLAALLQAGDLVILSGELGAGKTTFTQGLGRRLGVRAGIISPTFVLVRIHPNLPEGHNPGGPDLVHVDAYRLATAGEIDDIDLENTMDNSVTVVEWGVDRVEHLAASRLEIELLRAVGGGLAGMLQPTEQTSEQDAAKAAAAGDHGGAPDFADSHLPDSDFAESFDDDEDDGEPRTLRLRAVGTRWAGTDFSVLGQLAKTTEQTKTTCES
ncbi:tRNA (adenosine(37)-N6)-threonylcarbamoyltransferase complex ATPase subunit type 1 TsaE [Arthrobacter sp. H35-D1]|uniref:tRNA (adenosine(37)-N6)-threonylcarbamoyltransferase complex ATPase subunit type 1 TsaE n=1 Tax=Arthrobacter sp. H35-D1 TaxID=3046202 RepID=UPI0024BB4A3E|nr:tRNA (adenosine(37)-N6)-threonylcarbamoyltransferase complex ATPase subunit type 1 TsaE [Arthrobacter sp. H35-D1]MDJ0315160.1 tRNA (adenosine(37)-N6)-threonylcarbamoyltransferase complex ATPase subunit type 1 TsaE [Arthrobacter sp. H35-D1]